LLQTNKTNKQKIRTWESRGEKEIALLHLHGDTESPEEKELMKTCPSHIPP